MIREIRDMLGLNHRPSESEQLADREIRALRSRLNTENIGLKRARILLRTELLNEILKGPERPRQ